eukprot:NODE_1426_length_1091_cov_0.867944.p1 type:complete len:154 gc:universal NODE_1426_length_1091_cov_0.867944:725-264(-)
MIYMLQSTFALAQKNPFLSTDGNCGAINGYAKTCTQDKPYCVNAAKNSEFGNDYEFKGTCTNDETAKKICHPSFSSHPACRRWNCGSSYDGVTLHVRTCPPYAPYCSINTGNCNRWMKDMDDCDMNYSWFYCKQKSLQVMADSTAKYFKELSS